MCCNADTSAKSPTAGQEARTFSSFDRPGSSADKLLLPKGAIKFIDADLLQVLGIYGELSGRTVIRPANLPAVKINLDTQTPLTRREALQTLDTVLAANQIAMVLMGTKFVKAVPASQATTEAGPVIDLPSDQLPESGSFMTRIVKVKEWDPSDLLPMLQPFSKLPNSIVAIRDAHMLILRDYSANVRRMLEMLEKIEKAAPPPRRDQPTRAARLSSVLKAAEKAGPPPQTTPGRR
ncbi:MAG: hypothetical protein NTW03_06625 [Verrucomicrobia bacterium]|nr:hypothetical protein [Verrucomicrobiota bacterium]